MACRQRAHFSSWNAWSNSIMPPPTRAVCGTDIVSPADTRCRGIAHTSGYAAAKGTHVSRESSSNHRTVASGEGPETREGGVRLRWLASLTRPFQHETLFQYLI